MNERNKVGLCDFGVMAFKTTHVVTEEHWKLFLANKQETEATRMHVSSLNESISNCPRLNSLLEKRETFWVCNCKIDEG